MKGRGQTARMCAERLESEDLESLRFFDEVRGQAIMCSDIPSDLNIPALIDHAHLECYSEERWPELIADARLLFQKVVVAPAVRRAKTDARNRARRRR